MNKFAIRWLELAFMVLITVTGHYLTVKLPLIGMFTLSLGGIPAFVLLLARGKWFLPYAALTFITSWGLVSLPAALMLIPLVFMPAVFIYSALNLGLKPLQAVCVALLSATLFSTGAWAVVNGSFAVDKGPIPIKEHLAQQVQLVEKQLDEIETKNPDSYEAVHTARKNILDLYEFTQLLVPATFLFVWHVLTLSVFYMGAYKLSAKLDYKLSEFPAFTEWQFDWRIIWFYMTGLLLYHFLSGLEQISVPWLIRALGANLLAISSMIYYIAGLSLLFFMFDKYKAGAFTRFLMSFLALVFTQAVVWFGIIDVWADFRKPRSVSLQSDSDDSDSDIFN